MVIKAISVHGSKGFQQPVLNFYQSSNNKSAPKNKNNHLKEYSDNFVRNSKILAPTCVTLAGLWAALCSENNYKKLAINFAGNLSLFCAIGLAIAGADSLFQSKSKVKNKN